MRCGNTVEAEADGPGTRATLAISFSAASLPMSRIGWRIVVNEGHKREASGLSSKPMTVRSSGILTPRRYAVRYTPAAVSSLPAKIAVGGGERDSNVSAHAAPDSNVY